MKRLFFISLLLSLNFYIYSQTTDLDFKYIEGKKLSINLTTRILGSENDTIWHMDSSDVTISGKAVKVKLKSEDLVIIADITPYLNPDNSLVLVAKGEVFLSDNTDSKDVKYYTTLKSLPVNLGEKAVFFPLGMAYDSNSNLYNIEMEIQVLNAEDEEEQAKDE
ncbi:MAG: hypothetical protein PQJ46_11175 [Spirochaetales bacterium]|nr:hypothetical protein [Spirochaetales bacterium]